MEQARYDKKWVIAVCVMVFIVGFLVYANTIGNDFIWDDEYLILNNSQIKSFIHIGNVFKTYVGYGSENINNFYRPIQEISNMIDYFLWGEYSFGFHLTNVILHALVGVMVFLFLFYLAGDILTAAVAALFYVVHPVHSEAVAYVAGRADSLYSLFMLISLVFFIKFSDSARSGKADYPKYALSVCFFIVSLLSKEIIITMPLLIFLYMFYFLKGTEADAVYKKLKWYWVPYAAIVVVYGYLRLTVLDFSDIAPQSVFVKIPLVYRLLTFFRTILVYFRLMLFPTGLHMERAISISRDLLHPQGLFALAVILALVAVAVATYRKNRLVSFSIAWFFANLLPVSNIIPINSFLAEHWIYTASIGPFLLLGMAFSRIYYGIVPAKVWYRLATVVFLAVLIGAYARGTVLRNMDWKDEITFFNSTLKYHPRNARLYLNLGNTYYERGEIDQAIEQYQKAININKKYAVAYGNIGSAYLHKKDADKAEEYLTVAIKLKQNYPIAHYNLGIVYFQKRKYEDALKELQIATEQLPQLFQAWNMTARTYLKLKDRERAKEAFSRSLAIMPDQPPVKRALEKLK